MCRHYLSCFLAVSLLFLFQLASCLAAAEEESDLLKLNGEFRGLYALTRSEIRDHVGPVIILSNGKLVLLRNGTREEFAFIPEEWNILKTVDHCPLAIFVALTNHTGEKLSDDLVARLLSFKKSMLKARDDLQNFKFSDVAASGAGVGGPKSGEKTSKRQQLMLDRSVQFLDKVVSERFVRFPDLKEFSRGMSKMTMENSYDAVALELPAIDSKVQEWRKKMDKSEWDRLYVVITGSHMARQHERTVQYFMDLLGQKTEGDRLVFNEGPNDEKSSMDLLATHILDARVGEVFFGDKMRMHRDMLSDEATRYLRYHKAR